MKYPWMPIFWGDFLANTMHLSAQEAGAYLFLIAHAWEHEGRIPGDNIRLARIAHVRVDQWKRVWLALENFFEKASGVTPLGCYTHRRVMDELHRLGQKSNNSKATSEKQHREHGRFTATSTSIPNRDSSHRKGMQPRARPDASLELQMASKQHLGIAPDKGLDYRSPPPAKSANVLQPLPDRLPAKRPSDENQNFAPGTLPQCGQCNCPISPSGEQKCWAKILANSAMGKLEMAQ